MLRLHIFDARLEGLPLEAAGGEDSGERQVQFAVCKTDPC